MSPQIGLFVSAVAFVGGHFLLSHPLRAPLVSRLGERRFQAVYGLVAIVTFGLMIYFYRAIGRQPPLWIAGDAIWLVASLLMWLASILLVGSFSGNPALPGAAAPSGVPAGVFRITRHAAMWSFALWALVHMAVVGMPKSLVFDGAILVLALGGAVAQDRKKAGLIGEAWNEWTARTAFVPFARGIAWPGTVPAVAGTLLFLVATWLHPVPAGFWRWIS